jgi:hypothetical protein
LDLFLEEFGFGTCLFLITKSPLKKMILNASGGPAGGQPYEKVAKHAFFACLVFWYLQTIN